MSLSGSADSFCRPMYVVAGSLKTRSISFSSVYFLQRQNNQILLNFECEAFDKNREICWLIIYLPELKIIFLNIQITYAVAKLNQSN